MGGAGKAPTILTSALDATESVAGTRVVGDWFGPRTGLGVAAR